MTIAAVVGAIVMLAVAAPWFVLVAVRFEVWKRWWIEVSRHGATENASGNPLYYFLVIALMLPWVVPTYVVGTLWGFMWQRDEGIVNHVLVDVLHVVDHKPFWLIGSNTFFAIVIPTVWRAWPVLMLIFLAALQAVPEELYEAARLDGATAWQRFRHITLPALKPVIVIQVMFQIIDNIYSYNIVAMMFGKGAGYPGEWGDLLMPLLTRQSFSYWRFGEGAAVSFVMMAVMLAFVAVWMRTFRRSMTDEA